MIGKSMLQISKDGHALLDGYRLGMPSDVWEDPEPPFDWLAALSLPKDWDELDRLSEFHGFSNRYVRFVLADESKTRFPGSPRMNPKSYRYPDRRRPAQLTLGHLGYTIGEVYAIEPGSPSEVPTADGFFLVGIGRFFDSELATAAWEGISRGIFAHVCTVLLRTENEQFGSGQILEVAIIDRPGCPGARILRYWDYSVRRLANVSSGPS